MFSSLDAVHVFQTNPKKGSDSTDKGGRQIKETSGRAKFRSFVASFNSCGRWKDVEQFPIWKWTSQSHKAQTPGLQIAWRRNCRLRQNRRSSNESRRTVKHQTWWVEGRSGLGHSVSCQPLSTVSNAENKNKSVCCEWFIWKNTKVSFS